MTGSGKRIDVLLVNSGSRAAVYQELGDRYSAIEPPSLAGLFATYLRKRGLSVAIVDAPALNLSPAGVATTIRDNFEPALIVMVVYGFQPSASTQNMTAAGVRRFLYMSTLKVNGERTQDRPFSEGDAPLPEDAYGISKWEAEQALSRISRETGLEVVVLRPPLVYGPGVKGNFLRLMNLVARGVPLPLASIENRRSLIYVGNLVDAILAAITSPQAAGNTYLVSDGEDVSTPQLVRAPSLRSASLD